MDIINAAKKISELGSKLDKYAREIAEICPEGSIKRDLLAYLDQIALYCHQLNITSKVKADVQNISGDLVLSGVSSNYMKYIKANMQYYEFKIRELMIL
jgi:catenin alpha